MAARIARRSAAPAAARAAARGPAPAAAVGVFVSAPPRPRPPPAHAPRPPAPALARGSWRRAARRPPWPGRRLRSLIPNREGQPTPACIAHAPPGRRTADGAPAPGPRPPPTAQFGTVSGKTEDIAGEIAAGLGAEAQDFGEIGGAEDLLEFDSLVVGAPTWHTGADTDRSGTPLDDLYDEIDGLDLSGKKVAVFGLGDSQSYSDNFCDAIEEIHNHFQGAGAEMVGYVSTDGYTYDDSKSVVDGKFLGLPIDEDSESDMSADRYNAWVEQLKGEGVN